MVARSTELPVERITRVGVGRHRRRSVVYMARVKVAWGNFRAVFDTVFKEADQECYIYVPCDRFIE